MLLLTLNCSQMSWLASWMRIHSLLTRTTRASTALRLSNVKCRPTIIGTQKIIAGSVTLPTLRS